MNKYIKLLRVKHYIKNGLILIPSFFNGTFISDAITITMGIVSFSLAASFVYIVNDIKDVEKDRQHPTKCKRAIASGEISIIKAQIISAICLSLSIIITLVTNKYSMPILFVLVCYIFINFMYSMGLKNIPIIDIGILSAGYVLRILYGSLISTVDVSSWLYMTIIAASFFLGLGKRRGEIIKNGDGNTRKVLELYSHKFLDKNMYMYLGLTIVFYSMWCINYATVTKQMNIIFTIPLILILLMRYSLIIEGSSDGDPIEVLSSDKVLIGLVLVFILVMVVIFYV